MDWLTDPAIPRWMFGVEAIALIGALIGWLNGRRRIARLERALGEAFQFSATRETAAHF